MLSSTVAHALPQSQPVIVHVETVRRGEVVDAEAKVRWLRRPQSRPQGWHNAILSINGTAYRAESFWTDDGEGHVWQVVDLRKVAEGGLTLGTDHYRITIGPDGTNCDCPHSTYRGCRCKHAAGVEEALTQLEAFERAEFELALAHAALDDQPVPF